MKLPLQKSGAYNIIVTKFALIKDLSICLPTRIAVGSKVVRMIFAVLKFTKFKLTLVFSCKKNQQQKSTACNIVVAKFVLIKDPSMCLPTGIAAGSEVVRMIFTVAKFALFK